MVVLLEEAMEEMEEEAVKEVEQEEEEQGQEQEQAVVLVVVVVEGGKGRGGGDPGRLDCHSGLVYPGISRIGVGQVVCVVGAPGVFMFGFQCQVSRSRAAGGRDGQTEVRGTPRGSAAAATLTHSPTRNLITPHTCHDLAVP
ncbi:hypothetical protein Pmani_033875 [Petrolisthes manimaculis]|uniref:Uncharacterized protein n=1 Tax=Petrolisthes manimaculis TaxID=1843537 RepID=A0AAE1NNN3_9EUCA|nr:hypothetical protein Pmani_033875 [Petrolisthes manimaculis]